MKNQPINVVTRLEGGDQSSESDVIPIENRAVMSRAEVVAMNCSDGDLFALFSVEGEPDQFLYSRMKDFSYAVNRQIEQFEITAIDDYTKFFLTGSFMVSRLHDFDLLSFAGLFDHEFKEIFNRKDFIYWTAFHPEFFVRLEEQPFDYGALGDEELIALYNETAD